MNIIALFVPIIFQIRGCENKGRQLVGGPSDIDVDDEDVKLYLSEALDKVNGESDPDYS